MKQKYDVDGIGNVDVPTAWYGDVGQYRGRVEKARRAMEEYGCDLVEFFWVGEGEGEGFIEPDEFADIKPDAAAFLIDGEAYCFKDRYDYEDLWMGPSLRVTERGGGTLYWYAKHHEAEITLSFRFDEGEAPHD